MRLRILLSRLCLALTLFAGQQAATLHELSHGLADLAHKNGSTEPANHVCEKCLALASLGHAMASIDVPPVTPELSFTPCVEWHPDGVTAPLHLGYRSRAPPVLA